MEEIWKDIPDYEGIYQASNLGRIRTCEGKTTYTKRHGIRHWKQKILKPKYCVCVKNKKRYDGRLELWKNGKHSTHLVARLVASAFYGKSNLTVNHIDGNSTNNCISNLEYISLGDNIRKGFETGLYHTQVSIEITNKKTQETKLYRSMSLASKSINRCVNYISNNIGKGIFENNEYTWKVVL